MLRVPAASAVKIEGERAYKRFREGEDVDMPYRTSTIHELELHGYEDGVATLELHVSSGTYVRAIADALGGHCRTLRRTAVGPFSVDDADEERILSPGRCVAVPAGHRPVPRGGRRDSHGSAANRPAGSRDVRRRARRRRRDGAAVKVARDPVGARPASARRRDRRLRRRPSRPPERCSRPSSSTGLVPTAITFDPHPRLVLGYGVELLATLERRLELFEEAGVEETLVLEFTHELQQQEPEEFAQGVLRRIGTEVVVAGDDFRFGHRRRGDLAFLEEHGFSIVRVPPVEGASSTRIRELLHEGDVAGAAQILGRPPEVDGIVVVGDERGGTLGFPTANLSVEPHLLVPAFGIYAGAALGGRAAISIGTNPHYGGLERRIEAHLLDFEGDLYGQRLVVELWQKLRDERAFESEAELIEQIARDVEETRRAQRPV